MAIHLKTKEDIETLKEAGRRHSEILRIVSEAVVPGIKTSDLDKIAKDKIEEYGDEASFLNYTPDGISYPYPSSLCVSINDEVVHGIPGSRTLKDGDVASLDLGLTHKGMIVDAAVTVAVGEVSDTSKDLISVTKMALEAGIEACVPGNTVGDIGHAIEEYIKNRGSQYGIIRILSGHGVGYEVHEDPYVPNYGKKGKGERLVPGMVIAIEPMVTLGTDEVYQTDDEYTYITADDSLSAHFEHTVAITEEGPIVLTKRDWN
ncbi:MAG: methionyl aminopeptidase [Candidatus Paceibacteria bacterium]|jgi:methionyl aminopeptidase